MSKQNSNCVKIGTVYGGWYLPDDFTLLANDVCYLAGAGEDISFDLGLATKFPCQIHIFDPTPRAIAHFEQLREATKEGKKYPINNSEFESYEVNLQAMERVHFHPLGWAAINEELKFYVPQNDTHVSHSVLNIQKTDKYFTAQCKNVRTIAAELGHKDIALLKMDIEGAEYQVISDLVDNGPLPRVLLVEFDEYHSPMDAGAGRRILESIEKLIQHGLYPVFFDAGNVTFLENGVGEGNGTIWLRYKAGLPPFPPSFLTRLQRGVMQRMIALLSR